MGERINKIKSRFSIIMNGDQKKPGGNEIRLIIVPTVVSLTYTTVLLIIPIISKKLGLDFNLPTRSAGILIPMLLGLGEILRLSNLSKASEKAK